MSRPDGGHDDPHPTLQNWGGGTGGIQVSSTPKVADCTFNEGTQDPVAAE